MLSSSNLFLKAVPALHSTTQYGRDDVGLSGCLSVWVLRGKFRHSTHVPPAKVNSGFLPPLFIQGTLLRHLLYFI